MKLKVTGKLLNVTGNVDESIGEIELERRNTSLKDDIYLVAFRNCGFQKIDEWLGIYAIATPIEEKKPTISEQLDKLKYQKFFNSDDTRWNALIEIIKQIAGDKK